MASKIELRQEIEALCAERGVSVPDGLQGMNFVTLQGELQRLQAELAAPAGDPPGLSKVAPEATEVEPGQQPGRVASPNVVETPLASPAPPAAPEPPAAAKVAPSAPPEAAADPAPAGPGRYYVAQGRMLQNTLRGKIGAFQQVKARDFAGGQAALDELVANGTVVAKPR